MKLVFLSHDSSCTGGAQKCLLDLIKGIRQIHPDWQIYLIFPSQGDFVEACQTYIDGYLIVKMQWWLMEQEKTNSIKKNISYWTHSLKPILKIKRFLKRIQPNQTISNTLVLPHLAIASRWMGISHTWFLHEIPETWHNIALLAGTKQTLKLVNLLSDYVLVPSDYAYRYYQTYLNKSKMHVILQAVEPPPSTSHDTASFSRPSNYSVLLVGAFDTNKGQLELLQAVRLIQQAQNNIHLFLIGPDIGEMDTCIKYVHENSMEEVVEIHPFTSDIYSFYQRTDIVAVCSQTETFGRVAVEAQLCGLPVILANTSANTERITDGVNGLLYEKGNIHDLACKIESLRPKEARQRIRQNLQPEELAKTFSAAAFAQRFCHIITN